MDLWRSLALLSIAVALAAWGIASRSPHPPIARRVVVPGAAIAIANLGLLGLLIGEAGASRAFSVGLHTLFRDHFPAVVATTLAAVVLGAIAARSLREIREAGLLLIGVLLGDILAALVVDLAYGEITAILLPLSLLTETIYGTQLGAVGLGSLIGYRIRKRSGGDSEGGPDDIVAA